MEPSERVSYSESEFKLTVRGEEGGADEVFKGWNPTDLILKLGKAHGCGTTRIRELSREVKLLKYQVAAITQLLDSLAKCKNLLPHSVKMILQNVIDVCG